MLKLKLQYFGHLIQRADSFEKTLMLGKIEGERRRDDRGWDGWMASPTQWTWVWVNSGSWWWTGRPDVLQSMGSQRVRHNWTTELIWIIHPGFSCHWICFQISLQILSSFICLWRHCDYENKNIRNQHIFNFFFMRTAFYVSPFYF